jgi:cholesterol oxidase
MEEYDYVIVGSGFGGSVSALRLSEKGYKVLVIEKGRHYKPEDFPKTNWNLKNWFWLPSLRFFGFFKMTFFRHIGVLSGVGVGGGSLVYANTLPRPDKTFYETGNWKGIASWEDELKPFYDEAERMLGVDKNPRFYDSDNALKELSLKMGMKQEANVTNVGVFFGEPEKKVPDPYFQGQGPERSGCTFCGGCMTGCRFDAKNSLDKNYLYLAGKKGAEILAEHRVIDIRPADPELKSGGYFVTCRKSTSYLFSNRKHIRTRGVIFSGGVLGTVRLLLDLRRKSLPGLSQQVGNFIRTNNESLILVTTRDPDKDLSKGIAIGSIVRADENSHLEAVRYGSGSGFWKLLGVPLTHGNNFLMRIGKLLLKLFTKPGSWLYIYFTKDFAKESVILLFMQHLDSALRFRRGLFKMRSSITSGKSPTAFMPFAKTLADETARITGGHPFVLVTEAITGIPTTAHILGGAVIGRSKEDGVIDKDQKVFGYEDMYVCDGSAISANPGVNPSLTITAMSERAMSKIPAKVGDGR